jgi:acyl-CoA thioesterase I
MALPVPAALLVGLSLLLGTVAARAQGAPTAPPAAPADAGETSLSPECKVPGSKLYTIAKLGAVKTALREHRAIHVMTLGPAASPGLGLATPYPVRLETELTKSFPGVEVDVEGRTVAGEIASGAADRLRAVVAEVQPDLVVWQVGANDALARVPLEDFARSLDETIEWVKSHDIDLVLVDPQYTASLADDAYYRDFVQVVRAAASRAKVPLVQRYEATRYLADAARGAKGNALKDQFRLSDLSWRCMAEHVTRAITVSLLEADPPGPNGLAIPPAQPLAQNGTR